MKQSDAGRNAGCGVVFSTPFHFFDVWPIRMVCPVVKCLGMGHKAENPAGRIADPGDVIYRPIGIERKL